MLGEHQVAEGLLTPSFCGSFPQSQAPMAEHESERSPVEHDSLMQSDEVSDASRKTWTASSQRSSRHLEDEYSDAYTDLYQPHRNHNSGLRSTNGHDSQDRLLERDSEHNHNDRNWQRNRPWAKDSYWNFLARHPGTQDTAAAVFAISQTELISSLCLFHFVAEPQSAGPAPIHRCYLGKPRRSHGRLKELGWYVWPSFTLDYEGHGNIFAG